MQHEGDTQRCLLSARKNFRLLSSFSENELSSIKVREGAHGVELIDDQSKIPSQGVGWGSDHLSMSEEKPVDLNKMPLAYYDFS